MSTLLCIRYSNTISSQDLSYAIMTQPSKQQTSKPIDSRQEKSYTLISGLIDHFIANERGNLEKLKLYLTNLVCMELRHSIRENISTIISEQSTIRKLEQQLKDKDCHIEQLELMVFELQSLVRLKSIELSKGTIDDDVQFNSTSSSKVIETVVEKHKKKNLAFKLRNIFSITSRCKSESPKTASDSES